MQKIIYKLKESILKYFPMNNKQTIIIINEKKTKPILRKESYHIKKE
jgi:hypothetical protein